MNPENYGITKQHVMWAEECKKYLDSIQDYSVERIEYWCDSNINNMFDVSMIKAYLRGDLKASFKYLKIEINSNGIRSVKIKIDETFIKKEIQYLRDEISSFLKRTDQNICPICYGTKTTGDKEPFSDEWFDVKCYYCDGTGINRFTPIKLEKS